MGDGPVAVVNRLTAGALVASVTERLRASATPSPRLDAELLVGHALGRDRAWLHAHPEAELVVDQANTIAAWAERRAAGEPIAYIRGFKEWLSLRLATDRRALIPRPETELLAEAAVTEIASRLAGGTETVRVWEVATGSGAVALALALRFRSAIALGRVELAASDLSADALELASENLHAHRVASLVSLACGDLLEPASVSGTRPDVLVANLPYLTSTEVSGGIGSIAWEPPSALDGGPDGLDLLHRLVASLSTGLAPCGTALLEVGEGQAESVRGDVADIAPRAAVTTLRDLAGVERVLIVRLPDEGGSHA